MNFNEALELLKQGKKVRRSCWANCHQKYLYLENNEFWLTTNEIAGLIGIHYDNIVANDWEEYKEPLLTEEEKEYLKMVIKFHPRKIESAIVCLRKDYNLVYLQYEVENEYVGRKGDRPKDYDCYITKKDYFNNLKDNKEYTLKELGLEE